MIHRNYNLGRSVDESTKEFEEKLYALIKEYDVYIDIEDFNV
jgi:hypothetical protein